jgi:hypothetical protein
LYYADPDTIVRCLQGDGRLNDGRNGAGNLLGHFGQIGARALMRRGVVMTDIYAPLIAKLAKDANLHDVTSDNRHLFTP